MDYRVIYELSETGDRLTIDEAAATLGITKDELQAEVDRRCEEIYNAGISEVEDIYLDDLKRHDAEAEADARAAEAEA